MATPPKVQIKRTETPNNPPVGLLPGELSVEMANPVRLWVGVPTSIDPSGKRLLSVPQIVVADVPPTPEVNQLWWESDSGILWLWYNDGTSAQWVQISSSGGLVEELPDPASEIIFTPGGSLQADDVQEALLELDAEKVAKAGDAMTGLLLLSGAPVNPLHAATKAYVDALPVGLADAPSDSQTYGRNNGVWVVVDGGGGGEFLPLAGGTLTGPLVLPVGSAAATTLNFGGANTGIYGIGTTNISFAISGVSRVTLSGSTFTTTLPNRTALGTVGAPAYSFTASTNTGIYCVAGSLNVAVAGVEAMRWAAADNSTLALGPLMVSGNPTVPLQTAPKQYVDAAALDVAAYSGMQVNGGFEVSQEFGGVGQTVPPGGIIKICDTWIANCGAGWAFTSYQHGGAFGQYAFKNFIALSCSVPAAVAATDINQIYTALEGVRISRLMWGTAQAKPLTIAFWVMAHKPGVFSVAIRNNGAARSCVQNFTINAALTWEYKVVTFPGDTTGTWLNTNGIGAYISFAGSVGTTYRTATLGAWQAGNFMGSNTIGNAFTAANDSMYIANVMFLPGSLAPTQDQQLTIGRPFNEELDLVQRYYQKSFNYADVPAEALQTKTSMIAAAYSTAFMETPTIFFKRRMRAAPTIRFWSSNLGSAPAGRWSYHNGTAFAPVASNAAGVISEQGFYAELGGAFASAGSYWVLGNWTADARL